MNAWERNAKIDPLFSILADNRRRGAWSVGEFFESGEVEIDRVFTFMEKADLRPNHSGRFLDFGCGVGRNARALMKRFRSGIGLDASPTMISLAQKFAEGDPSTAEYLVNQRTDLSQIADRSIDFIYSHIVLQHMPSSMQRRYVAEFMRVLDQNGIAAFQVATAQVGSAALVLKTNALNMMLFDWLENAFRVAKGRSGEVCSKMHVLPHNAVSGICSYGGGTVLLSTFTNSAHPSCNGHIEFMGQKTAIDLVRHDPLYCGFLSEFFFVRIRVDDAMHATRAAVEEGILPGGGVALLRASEGLKKIRTQNDDQKTGIEIVRKALSSPARQIATNAGEDGSVIVGKILEKDQYAYGFDAQSGEYVNMVSKGIIDPTKVVRSALQNAASIAGLLITTEAMVAEKPKKDGGMPAMPGGGMGGMGGMDY
jgi:ubiquinone/menaquinone biosynthesis C-methylase UbiE